MRGSKTHRVTDRIALALAIALVLVLAIPALSFIDANFTPVDLVNQSDLIVGLTPKAAGASTYTLGTPANLKGQAPAENTLDLSECKKDQLADVKKLLDSGQQILLFAGTFQHQKRGYLHLDGNWADVSGAGDGTWKLLGFNARLTGTYAGGTDMLVRMAKYIVREADDASVPVNVGTKWIDHAAVGKVEGACGMATVSFEPKAQPLLFVASESGDRLFKPQGEEFKFEDATAAAKLDTRSRVFAWIDLDRDGIGDLLSFDGTKISARLAKSDATFEAAAGFDYEPRRGCNAISALATDAEGTPGVLLSTDARPVLLTRKGEAWEETELPAGEVKFGSLGRPAPCVAADLDGDGWPDVLQAHESAGVLWKGGQGGFADPVQVSVTSGGGLAKHALGDFNHDGLMDVFMAGESANQLWEADGQGGWRGVLGLGGSLSYKAQPGVSQPLATDLNNDGRMDLALLQGGGAAFSYHFNRGFRSFGEEGELKLPGTEVAQVAGTVGDFNADGAQDLAFATNDGQVICAYVDNFEVPGVRVRLKKGCAGPVTVSVWQGAEMNDCMAMTAVGSHLPGAFLNVRFPGKCLVKWRLPGKPAQSKTVEASGAVELVLE